MTRYALEGKFKESAKLHYKLTDIIEQLFADGNPGGIKHVLEMMKICGSEVRLPLVNVNEKTAAELTRMVKSYK
jgi:4-hydroxy-tetrahydrodipicolinate synthase